MANKLKRDTVKLSNTMTIDKLQSLSIDVHVRFKPEARFDKLYDPDQADPDAGNNDPDDQAF